MESPLVRSAAGLWLFNEGCGGRITDLSGNGLHLDGTGHAPTWGKGKFGLTPSFAQASAQYYQVPASSRSALGDIEFTFALWAQYLSGGTNPALFGKRTGTLEHQFTVNSTNRVPTFTVGTSGGNVGVSGSAFTSGADFFVAVTRTKTPNQITIQQNMGAIVTSSLSASTLIATNASSLQFGNLGILNTTTTWNGLIHWAGFWKRALSQAELGSLYRDPFSCVRVPAQRRLAVVTKVVSSSTSVSVSFAGAGKSNRATSSSGSSAVNLAGLSSQVRDIHTAAVTAVALTGLASETALRIYSASAIGRVNLSGLASEGTSKAYPVSASSVLRFAVASGSSTYLGRFVRGQTVLFSLFPVSALDSVPTLTLSDDLTSTPIATALAPITSKNPLSFALPVQLGSNLSLGTLRLTFVYTVGGVTLTQVGTFDLIDGGDSGGRVISLCGYTRPNARYLLAQLDSGRLVQGKNPRV